MNESTRLEKIFVYDLKPIFGHVPVMSDFHQARLLVYATDLQLNRSTTVDVDVDRAARGRLGDGMIYT